MPQANTDLPGAQRPDSATRSTWPAQVAETIARQIKYWRTRRKLSAQALANRTKTYGHEIPRSVIANIENGRREAVGFADLLVLAAALDVPPILLFAPVGLESEVQVLPTVHTSAWEARGWFHGAIDPPYEGFDARAWQNSRRAIALYDIHRGLVRQLRGVETQIQRSSDQDDSTAQEIVASDILSHPGLHAEHMTELIFYIDRLRTHRRLIAAEGLVLPDLPPDIAVRMGEDTSSGRHRAGIRDTLSQHKLLEPVVFEQLRPRLPNYDDGLAVGTGEPPER